MCIGIPMQVVETGDCYAWCEGLGERRQIDTLLVGELAMGTWVLTFLNSAREILTVDDAARITAAVQAVNLVMQGGADIDHLFADLVDREPQLPEFVQQKSIREVPGDC